MLTALILATVARGPNYAHYASLGAEALAYIDRKLTPKVPGPFFDTPAGKPATLLDHAQLISALAGAASVDPKYTPQLKAALELTEHYWDATGKVPGYRSDLSDLSAPRSYADNAYLAHALLQAAALVPSTNLDDQAARALNFVLSGVVPKQAGILVTEGTSHPLSLAPSAVACLGVMAKSEGAVSPHAVELYDWIRSTLRDDQTKLFHPDTDSLTAGPLQGDAGWMIDCAAQLYLATHEEKYAEQARRMESMSLEVWPLKEGYAAGPVGGVSVLLEAWFFRFKNCPRPLEQFGATTSALASLDREASHGRDRDGAYGAYWGVSPEKGETGTLFQQASAARAFFAAAKFLQPAKSNR